MRDVCLALGRLRSPVRGEGGAAGSRVTAGEGVPASGHDGIELRRRARKTEAARYGPSVGRWGRRRLASGRGQDQRWWDPRQRLG